MLDVLDTGCWMLDTGYWMLDTGWWILVVLTTYSSQALFCYVAAKLLCMILYSTIEEEMKKLTLFTYLFLLLSVGYNSAQDAAAQREKFDPKRDPYADVRKAVEMASEENKRILLDVGGEWCIWCHRLDNFIEESAQVKKFLTENYIVVKVNFSPENKNEKFLSQYPKVPGYPHLFVLEKDGTFLHSQGTGEFEIEKSYSAELLLDFFKKLAPAK